MAIAPITALFTCLALTWSAAANPALLQEAQKPNIILFLVDDLGWQDTSVPIWFDSKTGEEKRTQFNDRYRTPTLEKLANQGVRFSNAYACAVCSPTRTSIMTGQNAARHQVTQWTLRPGQDPSGKTERLRSPAKWRVNGIQPKEFSADTLQTLPALLNEAGYRTIHAGKAHWGTLETPGADPTNLGFDVNIAGHHAGAPSSYQGEDAYGHFREGQTIWSVPGLDAYHGLPVHLTDALTIEANRAITDAVQDDKPFFLYMAHYAVHAPIQPHHPHMQKYLDAGLDAKEARYASMIEGMDHSMKSLLRTVDELGQSKNTIVLFASDNGGLSVHARGKTPMGTGKNTHNLPLRAGKGSAYEGGTRIPQWVAWAKPDANHPAQIALPIAGGAHRSEATIVEDFYPTILHWAGIQAPDWLSAEKHADENGDVDPKLILDGKNFTGLLRPKLGEMNYEQMRVASAEQLLPIKGLWKQRPLLFHYPHVWGPNDPDWGYEPHSAMRLGDWKVIYFYQPKRWELYDLSSDIGEANDLAVQQPKKLRKMAARMLSELEERGAQWPTHRELKIPEPLIYVDASVKLHAESTLTPMVFIHGWSGDRHSFDKLLPYFSKERSVLTLDLPGHGRSLAPTTPDGNAAHQLTAYAEAVAGQMDLANMDRAIVVGHSNGAPVAREFARLYPERAAGIVSLDGTLVQMFSGAMADQFADLLNGRDRDSFLTDMTDNMLPKDLTPAEASGLRKGFFSTPTSIQIASIRAVIHDDKWPTVNLEMPLLLIHAEAPTWTDEYKMKVAELGPNVELEVWQNLTHFLHWQVPERVYSRVNTWIQRHSLDG